MRVRKGGQRLSTVIRCLSLAWIAVGVFFGITIDNPSRDLPTLFIVFAVSGGAGLLLAVMVKTYSHPLSMAIRITLTFVIITIVSAVLLLLGMGLGG